MESTLRIVVTNMCLHPYSSSNSQSYEVGIALDSCAQQDEHSGQRQQLAVYFVSHHDRSVWHQCCSWTLRAHCKHVSKLQGSHTYVRSRAHVSCSQTEQSKLRRDVRQHDVGCLFAPTIVNCSLKPFVDFAINDVFSVNTTSCS